MNDIEIDGEKRQNSGKGYRALYLSAFMLGVMLYCLKNNLKHPNFLVLDSPLTAYKERDSGDTSIDPKDKVSDDIQERFYRSITKISKTKKIQIIVIDNKEPPKDIEDEISHEHFSKNDSKGRYGFYPHPN